ncbi:MAG: hypothetical protein JJ868_12120 [Shimia sp.]|uniref:hypothetical protein n=1 Tax=Shimia sp. TaxID=1954381 RepID=UPI001B1E1EB4|nr:hypothetical protein [Shimia sp.]MBO6898110.1 hypothetical protein [Shimia sp.]
MSYAPDWVLHAVCSTIATRFVEGNLPIEAFANKMSKSLLKTYADCKPEKLYGISEAMLFFLAELEEEETLPYCSGFLYNSICFEKSGRPRKMRGLFFDPLASARELTKSQTVVTSFKAFVFRMRNDVSLAQPKAWRLDEIAEIKSLTDILNTPVTFADAL